MSQAIVNPPSSGSNPTQRERDAADACRALTVIGQIVLLSHHEVTGFTPAKEGKFIAYHAQLQPNVNLIVRPACSLVYMKAPRLQERYVRISPDGNLSIMQVENVVSYLRYAGLYVPDPEPATLPEFARQQLCEAADQYRRAPNLVPGQPANGIAHRVCATAALTMPHHHLNGARRN